MTGVAPATETIRSSERLLAESDRTSVLSEAALRLSRQVFAGDADARGLTEIVEPSAALSERLWRQWDRLVDSSGEAATTEQMIRRIGTDAAARSLLAAACAESGSDSEPRDRAPFWLHCIGVACVARRLASAVESVRPDEAFVCGLLHDVGKVVLEAVAPRSFQRVIRAAAADQRDFCDVEQDILGTNHTIVGRRAAARAGLPGAVIESAWFHHHRCNAVPAGLSHRGHVAVVQLADAWARRHGLGRSGNSAEPRVNEYCAALGLTLERADELLAGAASEVQSLAESAGLIEPADDRDAIPRTRVGDRLRGDLHRLATRHADLQRHAGYLAALGKVSALGLADAGLHDACPGIAAALLRALGAASVIVFAGGAKDEPLPVGVATRASTQFESIRLNLDRSIRDEVVRGYSHTSPLVPLPAALHPLAERFDRERAAASARLLPLIHRGEWVGGAVIVDEPDRPGETAPSTAEVAMLAAAAARSIAQCRAYERAVRMSEDLADLMRRWSAGQEEAWREQSLSTIAEIAGGAAHELNTPLAVISGRAQYLLDRVTDENAKRLLANIVEQAERCSRVMTELDEFAHPRTPEPEPIELPSLLDEVRRAWIESGQIADDRFALQLSDGLRPVYADREQLQQILHAVLQNAIDATDQATRVLTIKAAAHPADEANVIAVIDNGRGMAPEVRERAWAPFFSWRPAGRGRGLGLSRVWRWVTANAGRLRLESREGQGTTVEITLPVRTIRET